MLDVGSLPFLFQRSVATTPSSGATRTDGQRAGHGLAEGLAPGDIEHARLAGAEARPVRGRPRGPRRPGSHTRPRRRPRKAGLLLDDAPEEAPSKPSPPRPRPRSPPRGRGGTRDPHASIGHARTLARHDGTTIRCTLQHQVDAPRATVGARRTGSWRSRHGKLQEENVCEGRFADRESPWCEPVATAPAMTAPVTRSARASRAGRLHARHRALHALAGVRATAVGDAGETAEVIGGALHRGERRARGDAGA